MSAADVLTDPTPVVWTDAEVDRMVSLGILPANHLRQGVRFTRDQYFDLAEHGFFDGRRVMLIHGEVLETAALKYPHASAVSGVADAFRRVFGSGYYVQEEKPLDVNTVTDPEPDVAVVPGTRKSYSQTPTASVALIVVEVADTTGITDYWVLDAVNEVLHVFRDPAPLAGVFAYHTHLTFTAADAITLLAVPNVPIPVADLLP